jgi:hypothetical protein
MRSGLPARRSNGADRGQVTHPHDHKSSCTKVVGPWMPQEGAGGLQALNTAATVALLADFSVSFFGVIEPPHIQPDAGNGARA